MTVLLLCTAFNGLSQRVWCDLRESGTEVYLHLDTDDDALRAAIRQTSPRLILAPYLKRRVPADICAQVPTVILHPGPPGDRGPSALDWALLRAVPTWGVTAVRADEVLDAGDVYGFQTFPLRKASKSSVYGDEVTDAAARLALLVVRRSADPGFCPVPQSELVALGQFNPALTSAERRVSFADQDTETLLRAIRASDGRPGSRAVLGDRDLLVFGAHRETRLKVRRGELRWQRNGAVLVGTLDGALWIGAAREPGRGTVKLPAADLLGLQLPESTLTPWTQDPPGLTFRDLRFVRYGQVGVVQFDFLNGALSTDRARRLLSALRYALDQDTRVVVLQGGRTAFCNGIDLNTIEASARPAAAAWDNIQAINDVCSVLTTARQLTIAALGGNAGAGGAMLPLAADLVLARAGVVLNPHYRHMGLTGSELWTYHLPRRVGPEQATRLTESCLPLSSEQALGLELVDAVLPRDWSSFQQVVLERAQELAHRSAGEQMLRHKLARLSADFTRTPLKSYLARELKAMRRQFFEDDLGFQALRAAFVRGLPQAGKMQTSA